MTRKAKMRHETKKSKNGAIGASRGQASRQARSQVEKNTALHLSRNYGVREALIKSGIKPNPGPEKGTNEACANHEKVGEGGGEDMGVAVLVL